MNKLTWKETIKLGKDKVTAMLNELGISYNHIKHYFKLCSLLYRNMKQQVNNVVSLLQHKESLDTWFGKDSNPRKEKLLNKND